jgi:hypothetical protein
MKRTVKLTERKLKQMISESVKRAILENTEYEKLYDEIQDVTNNINNFCGFARMNGSTSDEYTLQLMDKLSELSSELSDTAHELEEHLAWD